MVALERQKYIINYLKEHQVASTKRLGELMNVSLSTVRRDLRDLENQGLLMKTHGGVKRADSTSSILYHDTKWTSKPDTALEEKDAIARKASEFINSNDIIFIGAGMTCNLLCKYITESHKSNITVVTTNITAVMELASNPQVSVLLLGGNIHTETNHIETIGEYTSDALAKLYFDKVFFTVDGVDLHYGYSIINRAQLPLYGYLFQNTRQAFLLANTGKFDRRTFTYLCNLDEVDTVIVNSDVPQAYLEYYQEKGIEVYMV
ncbi:MAG: DeoR/GlpR family DNA-binding transcription regulator [Merdimonas faecis]|uniref:DeoR/GlpR family DNA-binding transcription regulator n=1 Tax=Merdimonas faecis TaxID=1653435 RepID=UPI0039909AB8